MACPNVNLDPWKNLVAARGEQIAYYLWDKYDGNVPESESKSEIVKAGVKATDILQSDKAVAVFSALAKNKVTGEPFWKKLQADLGIPKEQLELLKSFNTEDREELITNMLGSYSYAVEINTITKTKPTSFGGYSNPYEGFSYNGKDYYLMPVLDENMLPTSKMEYYKEDNQISKSEYDKIYEKASSKESVNTNYYANLTVPGGTNYTENEIATPAITPSIKGHAQFATDQGIGWFRSDEQVINTEDKEINNIRIDNRIEELQKEGKSLSEIRVILTKENEEKFGKTKTRRILEVQSDLFQKGRDLDLLALPDEDSFEIEEGTKIPIPDEKAVKDSKFLQLLNKGANWVTFFIKSIIQDSAKKGYEKVVFPTGPTAYKIESGGESIEDFIKVKEDRIKDLEKKINKTYTKEDVKNFSISDYMLDSITDEQKIADVKENSQREIDQLKKEIEDVKRGASGLAATAKFYQETVTNVLKKQGYTPKQVADEYGNTWNEISLSKERDLQKVLFQMDEMSASRASKETLEKVKEAAKKMGVSIEALTEYAKKNPDIDLKGVNGVADLVRGVIAFASGREEALTEEMVHMATAILEQTNPKLVTEMLSKIDRFKIYKQTLEAYKNNKNYQLSNGKPDIRKIKKEAVDKLIAEVIISQNDGSTEFPELMQEENQSMIRKWWNAILDLIRGMYNSSNINIFEQVAGKVMGEEGVGTVADIKNGEVFFQIAKNDAVDKYVDSILDKSGKLKVIKATPTDKRHYIFDGKRVKETVTEKVKSGSNMPDRTGLDKQMDDDKQNWGLEGHSYIENYIKQNLIDDKGYALANPTDKDVASKLNPEMKKALKDFAIELVRSYDDRPGTRFLIEVKMVNENVKGMIASTIDFKVVSPDPKTGIKIDTYDWKFTSINKNVTEDIPWFKRSEWKQQMGEYTKMDYSYGAKPEQIGKARMVPFIMNYEFAIPGEPKSGLVPKSIEIGKLDVLQETKLYLLPVATDVEKTTSPQVDELIKSLDQQWEKLWKKPVIAEKREGKLLQLNQLSKAIRLLKAKMSFEPLAMVGRSFLKNANEAFKAFENLDYSKLTKDEVRNKLKELEEFKASAEKFAGLDQIFVSLVPKEGMSEENKKILASLEDVSNSTGRMMLKINELQRQYTVQIALKEGLTTETTKDTILDAEREVDAMSKTFLEGSKLSAKIIKLASNLIMNARSLVSIKVSKAASEYDPLIIALEKEAAAKGKTAFEMIGDDKTLTLVKKIDKKFYEDLAEAKKKKDKQFLLDNMDVAKYDALAKEAIKTGIEEINKMDFSTDEEEDAAQRAYKIKQIKNSYDIHSETFNGYESFGFSRLFKQVMKEDKHLSKEYIEMSKSKAALNMWTYLVGLNEKAREMGYLTKQGNSFFPLMEASLIQKISQGDSFTGELKDFFKDQYTVKVNEEQVYSKTDPETNKVRKEIPRLFTRTDKENSQLSRDLTKVVSLWTRSLLEYESNKDLEYTLLTLHSVEKSKGQLMVDENNNIIYEAGAPKVDRKSIKNADILETIVDDAIYGLRENAASLGNVALSMGVSKLPGKTDEEKETTKVSIKKGLEQGNILTRSLAVGLKLLVAIPNYVGYHLHAIINGGTFYSLKDFEKNNLKTTTGLGLSTIDKGLLDLIVPLNDDITKEKMRELAKKQGYIKYLSTWTFNDIMMITNAWPEKKLQLANAQSFNENSMVVNGKIVNIRQYLRKQDRETREKGITADQRKKLENTFEQRVSELKESSALSKIAKIENDRVVIPGVSDEELAKYRTKVIEFSRTLNGQMSDSNKADYRRDTIFRSFMMFKNWMPKMIASRTLGIQKNIELDEWEYGRVRAFVKTWAHLGLRNIFKMSAIINGTEEGLAILDEMLEAKKRDYFIKNGEELTITKEEFYDLMRRELSREAKELGLLFGIMSLFIAAKAAQPPEDATEEEKNRYKFWAKATNKIYDELAFYYNPTSFEGMTSGSVIPSISLLSRGQKIITHLSKEAYGYATDDEKMMDKAHPTKYFLDVIPVASQFNREILPLIDPELAKEMGIRVTVETGRR